MFNPKLKIQKFVMILLLCTMHFTASPTLAQEVSIVVSPPRTDILIKPGETIQKTIKVTNSSQDNLILKAQVIDFIVKDDAGTPIKVTEKASGRFLASPWFSLENSELTIPSKGTTELNVIITAPNNALPGGHYAGVFFEPIDKKGATKTVSYTSASVGSLFALNVEGNINYAAIIKDFSTKLLSEFGPVDFQIVLENQSDTHITPATSIKIKDMFGRQLETLQLDQLNIFPFTSRTQTIRWSKIWALGRFTATAESMYGPAQLVSRDFIFWIVPYRLIAALLVFVLVLLAIGISIRRHLLHREDQRDLEIDELKRKIAELENNNR